MSAVGGEIDKGVIEMDKAKIPQLDDEVLDLTAIQNNWPDRKGKIIEIDGSNIKVRYTSGNERWKSAWNLQIVRNNL